MSGGRIVTKAEWQHKLACKKENIFQKQDELLCIFGHIKLDATMHLLKCDYKNWMRTDVKKWRQKYRKGEIELLDCNQKSQKCLHPLANGQIFHTLCLTYLDENGETSSIMDCNAMFNFGWFCDATTYFFKDKKHRDIVLEWIRKAKA